MSQASEVKDKVQQPSEFSAISDQRLRDMLLAAEEVNRWQDILSKTQDTPLTELLRGVERLSYYDAYPSETVEDLETGCQYYFHAHEDRPQEYGHFHTYVMAHAIPEAVQAIEPATHGEHENPNHTHCHLVGVSVDTTGQPRELFTINHWSAREAVYSKHDLEQILDAFEIGHAVPSYPVNRWVTALLKLFRPQILEAFSQREEMLEKLDGENPETPSSANEEIDVTSRIAVSVDDQTRLVQVEYMRRQLI